MITQITGASRISQYQANLHAVDTDNESAFRRFGELGHLTPATENGSRDKGWWARQDSNLQQHGYEPWVLTN